MSKGTLLLVFGAILVGVYLVFTSKTSASTLAASGSQATGSASQQGNTGAAKSSVAAAGLTGGPTVANAFSNLLSGISNLFGGSGQGAPSQTVQATLSETAANPYGDGNVYAGVVQLGVPGVSAPYQAPGIAPTLTDQNIPTNVPSDLSALAAGPDVPITIQTLSYPDTTSSQDFAPLAPTDSPSYTEVAA